MPKKVKTEQIKMFDANHNHFTNFHSIKINYNGISYDAANMSLITGFNIHIYKTRDNGMIFAIDEQGFYGASSIDDAKAWDDLKKYPKSVMDNVIGVAAAKSKCNGCAR